MAGPSTVVVIVVVGHEAYRMFHPFWGPRGERHARQNQKVCVGEKSCVPLCHAKRGRHERKPSRLQLGDVITWPSGFVSVSFVGGLLFFRCHVKDPASPWVGVPAPADVRHAAGRLLAGS